VVVPTALQGDVMGDLSSRRGRVTGSDQLGGEVAITALVPTAELGRYAGELRSLSGGRGRFSARHHGHEPVPPHLADRVDDRTLAG
jgi:elongation factor G